jgi:hypothetical protein
LSDLFRLLEANPVAQKVFRRDFADELCAGGRQGPVVKEVAEPLPEGGGIEYLELYQQWSLDTNSNTYGMTQRLHLHGVGFELVDDVPGYHRKKGERIHWSISLTPLRALLSLPLKVNAAVSIIEDDINAKAFGHVISRGNHPTVTLGQVIHGVLWELSFHGVPEQQTEFGDELNRSLAEVKAGTAELVSGDSFFDELDRPGCEALFDTLGGQTPREISRALSEIEDDENAAERLEAIFGRDVVVKAQFQAKTGREFRKAFRAAAR